MRDEELNRMLAEHEHSEIQPSSGFVSLVMAAVYVETAAPKPIPFPWKRALPGIAAMLAAMAALVFFVVSQPVSAAGAPEVLLTVVRAWAWSAVGIAVSS